MDNVTWLLNGNDTSWDWTAGDNATDSGMLWTTTTTAVTASPTTTTTTTKINTPRPCYASDRPRCDIYMKIVEEFQYYGIMLLYIIGGPGNLLTIIILARMRPFNSSSVWLISLAVTDFLQLLIRGIFALLLLDHVIGRETILSNTICRVQHIPVKSLELNANLILVGLTIERFIAVWFPLKMNTLCTKTRAGIGVLIIAMLTFGVNMHMLETFRRHYLFAACVTRAKYVSFWRDIYDEKIIVTFFALVPLMIIVVMNILIVIGLRRSSSFQKQSSDVQKGQDNAKAKQQAQITRMLLAASIWFSITVTPFVFYHYIRTYMDWYIHRTTYTDHGFRMRYGVPLILDVLRFSNVVSNFLLYVVAARRFRQELIRLVTFGRFPKDYKSSVSPPAAK